MGLCRLLQACAVLGVALTARPLLAIHRETPFLMNLSNGSGGFSADPGASRGEPIRVAFESTADLKENGSVGSEIFIFVLSDDAINARQLAQVTNFQGDSNNPSVSNKTTIVAFDSLANINQLGGTARQIILWHRVPNRFVELTRGSADSTNPDIDYNGRTVVFQSLADLKHGGGLGIGSQIFLYDLSAGLPPCDFVRCFPDPNRLIQITNVPGTSSNPYITNDGRFVFFQSNGPVLGTSNGFQQIYVYDRGDGGRITQITNGAGDSTFPTASETGNYVAFQSQADLLGNGSTGSQIFFLDRERNVLKQVTHGASDSMKPSIGAQAQFISFLSTADLLGTGAVGQHLFFYAPPINRMFQVTQEAGSITDNPASMGHFILFDTDEDILRSGATGRDVYELNTWGRIPKEFVGRKIVSFSPQGFVQLEIGLRDGRSEAPVEVPNVQFPPIPVAGYGVFCLKQTATGTGYMSCTGGRPGGDLLIEQDHMTDDVDRFCDAGCREGAPCRFPIPSQHHNPCPACLGNVCVGGPNAGQPCSQDATCLANVQCQNGLLGICNGRIVTLNQGFYGAGGIALTVPVKLSLSLGAGQDTQYCTADDAWVFRDAPYPDFRLTTGAVTARVLDADAIPGNVSSAGGAFVGSVGGAFLQGAPFDCPRLEAGNFEGAVFVGALPVLDAPTSPPGFADVVVPVQLPALGGKPFSPCNTLGCQVITYCDSDADCSDGNVCNGSETCVANACRPGQTLPCDDGIACNGVETCDDVLGCQAGTPPNCDDGALCTLDGCGIAGNCTHTFIPGCCVTDTDCRDNDVCNGLETCVAGNCFAGTPLSCGDGNACNGIEYCDPTAGCQSPPPPNCNDGARCTYDTCNPLSGCVSTNIAGCCQSDADCRNTNVCDGDERCVAGNCVAGIPLPCDDGDMCNGVETCDPTLGCLDSTAPVCDDGAPCTADSCSPLTGCTNTSISGCCTADVDCQDTNACNGLETCVSGDCIPAAPLSCDDGNVCNGVETCNPGIGCTLGTPITCSDDGAVCTSDVCDPVQGCIHPFIPGCCTTDADCRDTNVCNGLELCVGGDCFSGSPLVCGDYDTCNGVEACDPALGCVAGSTPERFSYEGIVCQIQAIDAALRSAPQEALGGPRKVTRLMRLLTQVRRNLGFLDPGGPGFPGRTVVRPRVALDKLGRMLKRLDACGRTRRCDFVVAGPIRDLVAEAMVRVAHFDVGAPTGLGNSRMSLP